MTYRRWRDGLLSGYVPTFTDLTWYAEDDAGGHGEALGHLAGLLKALGVARVSLKR